ncbi:MAG: selenocysteine-specific translation elongation factor [Acidimicrobiales bacterium]|nr:MAG: selenocysteine-specific translation elongation factor [Acidimicrobiales bacterium]
MLALTGTDPDRFAEEKARGLTIDLGFAWTTLASGRELAFVDVPGHVRFIKNMLAGVGAVAACLFVVAATEGWKPQSEEHLRILELVGLSHGVVALTKVAGLDDEWRELAALDVADRVAGTFLEGADVVEADAPTGLGLEQLTQSLDRLLANTPTAADRGRPRLWVDRSFPARGAGTVVTGTLAGGTLVIGDELAIVGPSAIHGPASRRRVRVRGLQSHGQGLSSVAPGRRVAANLTGVAHDQVARGDALVRPGQWAPSRILDCSLAVLCALDHPVSRRGAYHAHIGSGEHAARLRVLGTDAIEPGSQGLVRLHLPTAIPLVPGDRYVLRESGRDETIGGGEVLDVAPVLPAARAHPSRSVARVVAERGWVDAHALERLTGERQVPTLGRWVVDPAALAEKARHVTAAVASAGPLGLDLASLDDQGRAVLAELADVVVEAGRAHPASTDRQAAGGGWADHPFVAALEAAPFAPPDPAQAGVDPSEVRELVRRGLVMERDGAWFAHSAVERAGQAVARLLLAHPEGLTVAAVRDELGTTRKHVLPLLAHLDATGVTRRRGDLRIGGPRLPEPA